MSLVPVFVVAGALVGCLCWIVGVKLTEGAPAVSPNGAGASGVLALLCVVLGACSLGFASLRARHDLVTIALVAVLAMPLLITLVTDIRVRQVFPAVLLPGLIVAVGVAAPDPDSLRAALLSGLGAGCGMALLAVLSRWLWSQASETPLGSGDIVIAATAGVMLGPERAVPTFLGGMLLGAVAAGLLLATGRAQRNDPLPYGAFLCLSTVVALGL